MHEDAHLEMLYEDRQGPWVDDDPYDGFYDSDLADDWEDDEDGEADPVDLQDEAAGNFTPGSEW